MKFEYVILLILAFNVVAALVRKRKARAESAPPKPPAPRDERPRPPARAEKPARGMGRDLLEELAKELGLETGGPERPRPEAATDRPEAVPESVAARPAPARPEPRPAPPERAARKARSVAPEPVAPKAATGRATTADLRDLEGLRRAFIAKEVLGPPVSRKR